MRESETAALTPKRCLPYLQTVFQFDHAMQCVIVGPKIPGSVDASSLGNMAAAPGLFLNIFVTFFVAIHSTYQHIRILLLYL